MTWFRDKTPAAWFQNSIHFGYSALWLWQDSEKPRSKQHVKFSIRTGKLQHINAFKEAIVQSMRFGAVSGPLKLALRAIHSGDKYVREPLRQTARVKPWSATEFNQFCPRSRAAIRPECSYNAVRVVPENVLPAKGI
jgi:hypothetical protein